LTADTAVENIDFPRGHAYYACSPPV